MTFSTTHFAKEDRWWIGQETATGRPYLAIPMINRMVDYHESYWITDEQYEEFSDNHAAALEFAVACRRREHDDLLILRPGTDRGSPRP